MKIQRQFETEREKAVREAGHISTMIVDLDRVVQILEADITAEEERSRISDGLDPAYPILARTLAARRDNLKATRVALERRLADIELRSLQAAATAA